MEHAKFEPWRGVFETLRVVDGKPLFLPEHRAELGRAMAALDLSTVTDFAREAATLPRKSGRWRWIVTSTDTTASFTEEAEPSREPVALMISPVRVGSCNWDARFKTLSYLAHAQALQMAGAGDAILINENGQVASASRSNVFWRRGDELFTPAHDAGCRRGVVRGFVLAQHRAQEGNFPAEDLLESDEIFLTNSMCGIVSVQRLGDRTWMRHPFADGMREQYEHEVQLRLQNRLPLRHW